MLLMFILHDDEVYIDCQLNNLDFFKYCSKLNSFIFPVASKVQNLLNILEFYKIGSG